MSSHITNKFFNPNTTPIDLVFPYLFYFNQLYQIIQHIFHDGFLEQHELTSPSSSSLCNYIQTQLLYYPEDSGQPLPQPLGIPNFRQRSAQNKSTPATIIDTPHHYYSSTFRRGDDFSSLLKRQLQHLLTFAIVTKNTPLVTFILDPQFDPTRTWEQRLVESSQLIEELTITNEEILEELFACTKKKGQLIGDSLTVMILFKLFITYSTRYRQVLQDHIDTTPRPTVLGQDTYIPYIILELNHTPGESFIPMFKSMIDCGIKIDYQVHIQSCPFPQGISGGFVNSIAYMDDLPLFKFSFEMIGGYQQFFGKLHQSNESTPIFAIITNCAVKIFDWVVNFSRQNNLKSPLSTLPTDQISVKYCLDSILKGHIEFKGLCSNIVQRSNEMIDRIIDPAGQHRQYYNLLSSPDHHSNQHTNRFFDSAYENGYPTLQAIYRQLSTQDSSKLNYDRNAMSLTSQYTNTQRTPFRSRFALKNKFYTDRLAQMLQESDNHFYFLLHFLLSLPAGAIWGQTSDNCQTFQNVNSNIAIPIDLDSDSFAFYPIFLLDDLPQAPEAGLPLVVHIPLLFAILCRVGFGVDSTAQLLHLLFKDKDVNLNTTVDIVLNSVGDGDDNDANGDDNDDDGDDGDDGEEIKGTNLTSTQFKSLSPIAFYILVESQSDMFDRSDWTGHILDQDPLQIMIEYYIDAILDGSISETHPLVESTIIVDISDDQW